MITCPNCQHTEYDGELLCSKCGASLVKLAKPETKFLGTQELEKQTQALSGPASVLALATGQIALIIMGVAQPILLEGQTEYTLGREANPDWPTHEVIDFNPYNGRERGVSRQHASLQVAFQQLLLIDLESTNGTRVNGQLLAPHQPIQLADGDEVRLGKLPLRIYFKF